MGWRAISLGLGAALLIALIVYLSAVRSPPRELPEPSVTVEGRIPPKDLPKSATLGGVAANDVVHLALQGDIAPTDVPESVPLAIPTAGDAMRHAWQNARDGTRKSGWRALLDHPRVRESTCITKSRLDALMDDLEPQIYVIRLNHVLRATLKWLIDECFANRSSESSCRDIGFELDLETRFWKDLGHEDLADCLESESDARVEELLALCRDGRWSVIEADRELEYRSRHCWKFD